MKTNALFTLLIEEAALVQARSQRDILAAQVQEMRALIRAFPAKLVSARLDEKQGIPTKYNYTIAAKACEIRVA